jgi:hypothetical protein
MQKSRTGRLGTPDYLSLIDEMQFAEMNRPVKHLSNADQVASDRNLLLICKTCPKGLPPLSSCSALPARWQNTFQRPIDIPKVIQAADQQGRQVVSKSVRIEMDSGGAGMGPYHCPIQHRYVNPRTIRDPVGKFLWDVIEEFDTIKPVPCWHWPDWEGGVYKFRQFFHCHDDAPALAGPLPVVMIAGLRNIQCRDPARARLSLQAWLAVSRLTNIRH